MWSLLCIAVLSALITPSCQQVNHKPEFENDLSETMEVKGIEEETPVGTVIGYLSCTDADNDEVKYWTSGSEYIKVADEKSGKVVVKGHFDTEADGSSGSGSAFRVAFICGDLDQNGEVKSTAEAVYDVLVNDINDQTPVFSSNQNFTFEISESAKPGFTLYGILTVSDRDEKDENHRIEEVQFDCSEKVEPCQVFNLTTQQIGKGTYRVNLIVAGKLDFETTTSYIPGVLAKDTGTNPGPLTGSTGILIKILDSPDTNPAIVNTNYAFEILEGVPVGQRANFVLEAQDMDKGVRRNITFEILNDPYGYNLFRPGRAIEGSDGVFTAPLFVASDIDREELYDKYQDKYRFTAKAIEVESDGTLTNATVTALFTVTILDINDNAPQFTQNVYHVNAPEADIYAGTMNLTVLVNNLIVTDPDIGENARFKVQIVNQTCRNAFSIRPNNDVQRTETFYLLIDNFACVDYEDEAHRFQVLTLKAVEVETKEQYSSFARVEVTITDVNDNEPKFNSTEYKAYVWENADLNTSILTVMATDEDSGDRGMVVYSLPDSIRKFRINPVTGTITLNGQLDKERYAFAAIATDKGDPPKATAAQVTINVLEYNDSGPNFRKVSYTTKVEEGSKQFLQPLRVQAIDPNDQWANITYRIKSGSNMNSFNLDPISGVLTMTDNAVYNETSNGIIELIVEAIDHGIPPQTAETIVTIEVIDRNDNPPVFKQTTYSATIKETIKAGSYVLTVSATDADYGTNKEITYHIGTGGWSSFNVLDNGTVYISSNPRFDYDKQKNLTVLIIAADGGSPQNSATATMSITITDVNNKPPSFIQPFYQKFIDEGIGKGASVIQLSATDPDTNHKLQYSLLTDTIQAYSTDGVVENIFNYDIKKVFAVNPLTGLLTVAADGPGLDRSKVNEMNFKVMVEDMNAEEKQTDIGEVKITITGKADINLTFDGPWTKEQPEIRLHLSESTPLETRIIVLQARDPVFPQTPVTKYEEIPNSDSGNYFRLNASSPGEVILNRLLDFESGVRQHSVTIRAIVEAIDNYPRRTATAIITVEVTDANDEKPQFTQQVYMYTISEGVAINHNVGTIKAYDADSATFGGIKFFKGTGQGWDDFKLVSTSIEDSVQIWVAEKLDFEQQKTYNLQIIAKDNYRNSESSIRKENKATIVINLTNENDNTPTFSEEHRAFSVPETAPIGTPLGELLASDGDFGVFGQIKYSLQRDPKSSSKVDPLDLFTIHEDLGVLTTKMSLLSLSGTYVFKVEARDMGIPSLSTFINIVVKVQGVEDDDGTPNWVLPVSFDVYVTENNKTKLDVKLQAVARTPNASITYSFGHFDDDYKNFRIDSDTGEIYVIEYLDREEQATYKLLIEATDTSNSTLMSRRELRVHLIDVDDNDPSFRKTDYPGCPNDFDDPTEVSVLDDTPAGTIVAYAIACDPDASGNNQMYYYLYNGSSKCQTSYDGALKVNLNGSVESTRPLDYEVKKAHWVCVEVSSSMPKPDTGKVDIDKIANIKVNILDRNDNGPRFPAKEFAGVLETLPPEDTVIQVLASDPDGPLNSRAAYTIRNIRYYPPNGNPPFPMRGSFFINPDNGVITANLPSYRDFTQGYFELEIEAYDVKNRTLNDTTLVHLMVYQRSQILKAVLDKNPDQGQREANKLINALNEEGKSDGKRFFLIKASEHRSGSKIDATMTDVCFVIVENKKALHASTGLELLDSQRFRDVMERFELVDRGTCYPLLSTEDKVKWRDLWWVLVAVAIFIFVCVIILLITIAILYNRYKKYMETHRTYLVPQ